MRAVIDLFEKCVELNHQIPEDAFEFALNIDDPSWLADMVASTIAPSQNERREVLLELDPNMRLKLVSGMLARELDVLQLESEIHSRVQSEVDRSQREMYLREQMKAIQTELGEGDIWTQDINDLRTRIENTSLPPEVMARATKEITRLSQLPSMSPEVGIIRAYIEWIVDLPWEANTEDNLDVSNAAKVLDEHHYGLKRPKERVLEFIAVRSLRPKKSRQPILCFAGPPGTGKTSLGRSIAKALGRKFIRMSLGGVRDEAEIRGHRRTYIGALPGRILQTMKRAGTNNPLIMLDEVDKLSSDSRGDPSSALLEVLDPEQNHQFSDHYLEVPYDLSKVMFITTANWTGRIPDPLLDRMEVIDFTGYIEEEKLEIARQFLIPRQVEENGLESNEINFSDSVIQRLIREYTYEAGVRNLEREIGRICRKIARLKAEKKRHPVRIVPSMLERFLGPPQFFETEAEREDEVGVATALVWTFNGGDINPIEVLLLEGKGNLQLTGQLGDVMQESAQAALSFVKSRADKLSIPFEQFDETDIHVHLPEGAIPKDGPSAGITLATAIISAFTDRKVRKDVGMTGEITLRGRVLPIGGLREKVLAAHRSGLNTIIIPQRNEKDLVDLPRKVKSALKIIPVAHMDEVIDNALLPAKKRTTRRKSKTKESDTD
jgi:ATP-dependent Lon protease